MSTFTIEQARERLANVEAALGILSSDTRNVESDAQAEAIIQSFVALAADEAFLNVCAEHTDLEKKLFELVETVAKFADKMASIDGLDSLMSGLSTTMATEGTS